MIVLPVGGIVIEDGTLSSDLHDYCPLDGAALNEGCCERHNAYNDAIDGVESLILAHACAGLDVSSAAYVEGIQTALDAINHHLTDD